jgi:patatin-like phospholipase/acyl hydrolase
MRKILSIDGGGIRGIIPASTLVALERQMGKPVRECFDFLAGTSTGALISAAAAAGIPAARILDIYTQRAHEIFTPGQPMADAKRAIDGYMYDPRNIQKVLVSEFGAAAQWTLNDAPVKILLTAKGIDQTPWYFVPDSPHNAQRVGSLGLVDCAVASACAPTYFAPWNMTILGQPLTLVDGGVGVTGNPVYQACIEAFQYDAFDPQATLVVSLGTGIGQPATTTPKGILGWVQWTVDALLAAPEAQQVELVNARWPGILKRYDWPLPHPIDMADIGAIAELTTLGAQAAAAMDWLSILG